MDSSDSKKEKGREENICENSRNLERHVAFRKAGK